MFAMPFGRIFWKEYRSNQALWISCLVIGVALQLLFLILSGVVDRQVNHQMRQETILGIAYFIPLLYVVGCFAVLFAAERENSTDSWLMALSAPPLPTLTGKLSFAVLSTIALQLVLQITARLFLVGERFTSPSAWLFAVPFAVMVWAALGSLTSRQVLVSIFSMLLWFAVPYLILAQILDLFPQSRYTNMSSQISLWILGIVYFFADAGIAWQWVNGKYLDGAVLAKLGAQLTKSYDRLMHRDVTPARAIVRSEHEQQWRRTWQRLYWEESRGEKRTIFWFTFAGSIALFVWLVSFVFGSPGAIESNSSAAWVWCIIVCGFYAVMIGVMSFRVDSKNQQLRFMANRGVAPVMLWLVKQVVWLPRAFYLPVFIGVLGCLLLAYLSLYGSQHTWWIVNQMIYGTNPPRGVAEFTLGPFCGYMLLAYASGQLSSVLFRRSALAMACSGLLLTGVSFWVFIIEGLQLTSWWSLGLPFVLLLAFALWQLKPWLLEDDSWTRRGKVAGGLVALPCALFAAVCFVRVEEIAMAPSSYPHHFVDFEPQLEANRNWDAGLLFTVPVVNQMERLSRPSDKNIQERANELITLIESNRNAVLWTNLPDQVGLGRHSAWLPHRVRDALETAEAEHLKRGRLDAAFECDMALLKLGRIIANGGRRVWLVGIYMQSIGLERLVNWSNHPGQDVARIQEAIFKVEEELNQFPALSKAIARSYLRDRKTIDQATAEQALGWYFAPSERQGMLGWLTKLIVANPAERLRARMLLQRTADLDFQEAYYVESSVTTNFQQQPYDDQMNRFQTLKNAYQPFRQTTLLMHLTSTDQTSITDQIRIHSAVARTGITRMELMAYRREHGKLPSQLIDLAPRLSASTSGDPRKRNLITRISSQWSSANLLVDPWTERPFEYYPAFLFTSGPWMNHLHYDDNKQMQLREFVKYRAVDDRILATDHPSQTPSDKLKLLPDGDAEQLNAQAKEIGKYRTLVFSLFLIPPQETSPDEQ